MADRLDVAGRLAEGRPAVERTQIYVQACNALGCQKPDLADVSSLYDAEAGLDLKALDADCTALRAAVNAIEEALWIQRAQVTELARGWRGAGADSATRFMQRHCDAAQQVTARVRSAADGCASLRDELWQSVDSKVATTIAIDDRRVAERSAWLAAAQSVTTGAADRSASEKVIRTQVIPYVDNDIRHDWLSAVHSAAASITSSYDSAIHALTSAADTSFEIPDDLGPQPRFDEPVPTVPIPQSMPAPGPMPPDPVPTVPASVPAEPESPPTSEPAAPDEPESSPLDDLSGLTSGAGGLGGLGGVTGGIGGVIGSIVDGIGSLIGSLTGGLGGTAGDPLLDDASGDTDDGTDDDTDELPADDAEDEEDDKTPALAEKPVIPQPATPTTESPPPAAEAADPPAAPPPAGPPAADQPSARAAAAPDGSTPCEIAEDQLPQAGQ